MEDLRELDAWLAEHVMGVDRSWCHPQESHEHSVSRYSSDWAAAGELVEKMQAHGWAFVLDNMKGVLGNWEATFEKSSGYAAESDTAPMAICLAAKKALEAR
jgi:hypothetical protein